MKKYKLYRKVFSFLIAGSVIGTPAIAFADTTTGDVVNDINAAPTTEEKDYPVFRAFVALGLGTAAIISIDSKVEKEKEKKRKLMNRNNYKMK